VRGTIQSAGEQVGGAIEAAHERVDKALESTTAEEAPPATKPRAAPKKSAAKPAARPAPAPKGDEAVHVNTATVAQLTVLPGVGEKLAQRIVDYRNANGPFKNMKALAQVSGVGPALQKRIEGRIAFD
jgi:competence protein ComEA